MLRILRSFGVWEFGVWEFADSRAIVCFFKPLTATIALGAVFGLKFPSNSKWDKYMPNIFFLKSYPYTVAMISDLKFWWFFYKFVPINFLLAKKKRRKRENIPKNGPQRRLSLSGPFVFVSDTRGLTTIRKSNMLQMASYKWETFIRDHLWEEKKNTSIIITFLC